MPYLSLVNPRRRRRHGGHRRRRNPDGTFLAANPRRYHHRHHRRRNPIHLHDRSFFGMGHHRRRRNPREGESMFQGADVVDFGVAALAYKATDLAGKEYATLTNNPAPSPWIILAVKALATIASGIVGEAILGRGAAAVMGSGLNATFGLVDQLATQVNQPPPFPNTLAAQQQALLTGGTATPQTANTTPAPATTALGAL